MQKLFLTLLFLVVLVWWLKSAMLLEERAAEAEKRCIETVGKMPTFPHKQLFT